jgi:hypothetical protein
MLTKVIYIHQLKIFLLAYQRFGLVFLPMRTASAPISCLSSRLTKAFPTLHTDRGQRSPYSSCINKHDLFVISQSNKVLCSFADCEELACLFVELKGTVSQDF